MYHIPIVVVKLVRDSSQNVSNKIVNNPKVAADLIRAHLDGKGGGAATT